MLSSECRAWWEKLDADHPLRKALVAVVVDKIIFMPIFDLHEFEPILQDLITAYDGVGHQSIIQYAQHQVVVSYSSEVLSRVFGIPNRG